MLSSLALFDLVCSNSGGGELPEELRGEIDLPAGIAGKGESSNLFARLDGDSLLRNEVDEPTRWCETDILISSIERSVGVKPFKPGDKLPDAAMK